MIREEGDTHPFSIARAFWYRTALTLLFSFVNARSCLSMCSCSIMLCSVQLHNHTQKCVTFIVTCAITMRWNMDQAEHCSNQFAHIYSCIFVIPVASFNMLACLSMSGYAMRGPYVHIFSYAVVYFYPNELRVPMHFCISVVLSLPNPRTMRCENTMRAAMQLRIPVATKAPGSSQTAAPSLAKHPTGKIEMG